MFEFRLDYQACMKSILCDTPFISLEKQAIVLLYFICKVLL